MQRRPCVFEINALRVATPLELIGLSPRPTRQAAFDGDTVDDATLRKIRQTTLKFRVLPRSAEKSTDVPSSTVLLSTSLKAVPPERGYEVTLVADGSRPYKHGMANFKATVCIRFSNEISFQVLHADYKVLLQGNLKAQHDSSDFSTSPKSSSEPGALSSPFTAPSLKAGINVTPKLNPNPLKCPPPVADLKPVGTKDTDEQQQQQQQQQPVTHITQGVSPSRPPEVKLFIGGRLIQRKRSGSNSSLTSIREEDDSCEGHRESDGDRPGSAASSFCSTRSSMQSVVTESEDSPRNREFGSAASDDENTFGSSYDSSSDSEEEESDILSREESIFEGASMGMGRGIVLGAGLAVGIGVGLIRKVIRAIPFRL
mmetsp:Transcript_40928/g.66374  ORF Transcript_40928/g.66374 Transcript_40928/m.66374 type:complete len:371 (+) Transcript_40928:256-1368(+)|eukprot:CAMPEP_0184650432 /NCGR_PEP_ID=MMETSP0308-20130426/7955_1 /TAXON_ID=38269 /ORGANISM="Gloeochaete witrockiana, Strain SAG 46.84" /LENGTH=370 /DNA_ID=CAMNT_0027083941 /DNA_START=214 /DNA_END=1326 /DNA_ORIENTATION=+